MINGFTRLSRGAPRLNRLALSVAATKLRNSAGRALPAVSSQRIIRIGYLAAVRTMTLELRYATRSAISEPLNRGQAIPSCFIFSNIAGA